MIADAVILAAGTGSRLGDDDLPKPLYAIGGTSLLQRVITNLSAAGVSRVVVVTGFMASRIRDAACSAPGVKIEFGHNPDFEKSNGISAIAGGRHVGGPFLLSMADHVYTPALARLVAASDLDAADLYLATDTRIRTIDAIDLEDATKVRSEHGRIIDIGKSIAPFDRIDCGVFAVTQSLVDALDELRTARSDCSLSDGVRRLAERGRARVVDIGNLPWDDVDTPADRERAERALG